MEHKNIYSDIAARTQGDIYIGVVGPVRTGKSTFIKRFMDELVIPNIDDSAKRERANDELPQSAAGRTIMTTEPKFIPEDAVEVTLGGGIGLKVRMIDCVGYIVPGALGYIEGEQPRMVKTPWFDKEIPFNMAAELGTKKVIDEHSTIGLVITTDGTIGEIPRDDYIEAEKRVIEELKALGKPFVVLLNSVSPDSPSTKKLVSEMVGEYGVPVLAVNCKTLSEDQIKEILRHVLFEFPIKEVGVDLPGWMMSLESSHAVRSAVNEAVVGAAEKLRRVRDVPQFAKDICECEYLTAAKVASMDLSTGSAVVSAVAEPLLFFKILSEVTGTQIKNEQALMDELLELNRIKKAYSRLKNALDEVEATGYGIVMPTTEELTLAEPEIMKQGGKYGIRLRASVPSVHMMRANITTEVAPIVGSESQSEELVEYLLKEFEEDPLKIWQSNIFGKSLNELVNEGLRNKLGRMPTDARMKLQETLEKVINEGCSGLICIIL
ncbi:MAG: stage IV sporulation protein A [Clostridia bacterium]|nr:stage IV sporulation protein A [Clostridia bacterium]